MSLGELESGTSVTSAPPLIRLETDVLSDLSCLEPSCSITACEKENEKLLTKFNSGVKYGDRTGKSHLDSMEHLPSSVQDQSSISRLTDSNTDLDHQSKHDTNMKQIPEESQPQHQPRQANCKRTILKGVVTLLFILIGVGVVAIWIIHEGRSKKHVGNGYFDFIEKKRELKIYNSADDVVLTGYIKSSDFHMVTVKKCDADFFHESYFCFNFEDNSVFKFFTYKLNNSNVNCVNIVHENLKTYRNIPVDCYDIEYGLWYGLPNFKGMFWPLGSDEVNIDMISYRPYYKGILGHILETYWLSTEGVAIIAHQSLPLKVSYNSGNDRRLCLVLDIDSIVSSGSYPNMNYSICQGPNVKETFIATRNVFFPKAAIIEYEKHDFSKVLWAYEDKYQNNPDSFGNFLHKLRTADLPINMIEFDAPWEVYQGDLKYAALTRSEISKYLEGKYSSVRLMLPISLGCSYKSENFMQSVEDGLFANDPQTDGFKVVQYDDDKCALWDATNTATREFLRTELLALHRDGSIIPKTFPQAFEFKTTISDSVFPISLHRNTTSPNAINLSFLNVLIKQRKTVLLESAFRLQNRPSFVQIPTTVSNRNGKKCLDNIIAGALTAGIHGYPFIMSKAPSADKIDQELFVRWLLVATFFPGLKVTNDGMNFGDIATNLSKFMVQTREAIVVPEMSKYLDDVRKGYPLLRPMWWLNPKDFKTLKISDQFLIGESILVAPVLCHGDRSRDIYLPEGDWVHFKTQKVYEGSQWLRNYSVPLDHIPVFTVAIQESSTLVYNVTDQT